MWPSDVAELLRNSASFLNLKAPHFGDCIVDAGCDKRSEWLIRCAGAGDFTLQKRNISWEISAPAHDDV
jgi:hypothetical protein